VICVVLMASGTQAAVAREDYGVAKEFKAKADDLKAALRCTFYVCITFVYVSFTCIHAYHESHIIDTRFLSLHVAVACAFLLVCMHEKTT